MNASPLSVTVVIPTRNRPGPASRALRSILAGDDVPQQIVIVDQSDPVIEWTPSDDRVNIEHRVVPSVGLSRNRNAGVKLASHDIIVFLDDDMVVDRSWLGALTTAFVDSQPRGVICGQVVGEPGVPSLTKWQQPETFTGRLWTDPLFTGNCAIGRAAFGEVGLFDPRLGAGTTLGSAEDSDFGFRLLAAGYHITTAPEARVHHLGEREGLDRLRLEWSYGIGQGAFYAKHLWATRGFTGRRFLRNLRYRMQRCAHKLLSSPRAAGRTLVHAIALVVGFFAWPLFRGRDVTEPSP